MVKDDIIVRGHPKRIQLDLDFFFMGGRSATNHRALASDLLHATFL